MQIQYFGLSSFKITTKNATLITDPFHKDSGLTPPRGSAELVVLAEKTKALTSATSGISGTQFTVADPGEYDISGVTITGIPLKQEDGYVTIYLIESEDIKILNLTHIKEFNISQDELESLGEIDILIVPVGGNTVLDATHAAKVVNQIEPKIVIPSYYATDGLIIDVDKPEKFIKEMGGKADSVEKLSIKRKDLSGEGTTTVILEPLR
jgi:L-ascorbate metabolism protein UlaG (beta-lactamase superfamily)